MLAAAPNETTEEHALLIAAAAGCGSRPRVPSTARLPVQRPRSGTSQSCHQPHNDAAPLKNEVVREGGEGDLDTPTKSSGQKVAHIASARTLTERYDFHPAIPSFTPLLCVIRNLDKSCNKSY